MKISTAELKKFKSKSSFMKQNNILPILGYLKFQGGKITKSNLHSFFTQGTSFQEDILVDENILYNFLNCTGEPMIDISEKDNRVFLSDGKSKVSFPLEKVENFPAIPSKDETTKSELSNDVFCAIGFAAGFVDNMDLPDHRAHVFVGKNIVVGCNGAIGYIESIKEEIPNIVLSKEIATVLGKFNEAVFYESESYIFFDVINDGSYGFVKSAMKFMDLGQVLKKCISGKSFTINKNDILSFTDMCVTSTKAKGLLATISMKNSILQMSMRDADFSVDVTKELEVSGEMEGEFNFNPALMSTLLRNIPDNDLVFTQSAGQYQITGESNFFSMIQQLK